ncbi:MAG: chromate transporter [Lentisphaerae bacterium]|jgi:chromate transporter|nr:chromate transporter [Lentisphaerota bacterium]
MKLLMLYILFLKFGILCIGGGNVLVPLYVDEFVESETPLLTHEEFGNLLAVSQITPGPVGVNSATFCGYRIAGVPGAVVATTGLLTPSLILLMLVLHYINKWSKSNIMKGLMRGLAPASTALIITALVIFMQMSVFSGQIPWEKVFPFLQKSVQQPSGESIHVRPMAVLIAAASTWILCKTNMQITTLILLSALIGALSFPFLGL